MPADPARHARHILLKEIGGPGQQRLARARVAIIGAGGLGAPAALYLAAAGIGTIRLIDPDDVSLDNLQRQILYRTKDVGHPKTERAKAALNALDPAVEIDARPVRADANTLPGLLESMDLVLDGCDDFSTRFVVNQAALAARIALVSGAVGRWEGQAGVFAPHLGESLPCYQCWTPAEPPGAEPCSVTGIVGALTGIIGSVMALEAIKLITGAGDPLTGRLFIHDGLSGRARTVRVPRDPHCPACGNRAQ
ncbi:HesA/MoeB/ThiF family protein [Alkalicaulis satelles]|uniref:HesA/MoeB/ThiF family protein n=1 Tax=Alkalicaulis satelles TaxID=2609175 RepID=UPI001E5DF856|nr:molybdopterin-synthase adenylyltransferase MoeB [Alkalicaulis satelles]